MLIRARFHTDQVEGRIYNVQMGRAVKVERPVLVAKGTEKCNCPEGYTGLSCELCELGYRAEKSPYGVTCIECDSFGNNSCKLFIKKHLGMILKMILKIWYLLQEKFPPLMRLSSPLVDLRSRLYLYAQYDRQRL